MADSARKGWTAFEDSVIRTSAARGESARVVAERLLRTRNMVLGRADRIGVKFGEEHRDLSPNFKRTPRRIERRPKITPTDPAQSVAGAKSDIDGAREGCRADAVLRRFSWEDENCPRQRVGM